MRRLAGVALVVGAIVASAHSARASSSDVTVQEDSYSPSAVTINVGDKVTWTYNGSSQHSVTADDGSFDSNPTCGQVLGKCLDATPYPHTFNSQGTFSYHCRVVASMVGTVTVAVSTTSSSTTTSTTAPTSTSETSTSLASDQPTVTQGSPPSIPSSTRVVALPKSIIRSKQVDDMRPWVFLDVALAGTTTIVGVVLVRRGRVPIG